MQFMNSVFHSSWDSFKMYLGQKSDNAGKYVLLLGLLQVKRDWAAVDTVPLVILRTSFPQDVCEETGWQQCSLAKSLLVLALVSYKQPLVCLARSSCRPMDKSVPVGQCENYATLSSQVQMRFIWLLPILVKFLLNQNLGRFSPFIAEHIYLWSFPPNSKNVVTEHPHSWRSQEGLIWVTRSRDDSMMPGYVRSNSHIQLKRGLLSTTDHLRFIYQ